MNQPEGLGPSVRFKVSAEQVSADLEGEMAILNMKDGVYYGLDAVGTRAWELLGEPRTLDELVGVMLTEFDVEEERLRADLAELVADLRAHQLLEVLD